MWDNTESYSTAASNGLVLLLSVLEPRNTAAFIKSLVLVS
jgi:hypothetical protein